MSPHASLYQNTPTGSTSRLASRDALPRLDSSSLLQKRRKLAPEGPTGEEAKSSDVKGKKKARSDSKASKASSSSQGHRAKDPLEIAYASILTSDRTIKEDDFEVDPKDDAHKPQEANKSPPAAPVKDEEAVQDDDDEEDGSGTPDYRLADEGGSQVWSK